MTGIILAVAITAMVAVLAVITIIAPDNHYGGQFPLEALVGLAVVMLITWALAL